MTMKPYTPPILFWVLVVVAILIALPALVMLIFLVANFEGSGLAETAAFGILFPVSVCVIIVLGLAQLVDCMGRTSHYTQQMEELLFRELAPIRKELKSAKENK